MARKNPKKASHKIITWNCEGAQSKEEEIEKYFRDYIYWQHEAREIRDSPGQVEISLYQYYVQKYGRPSSIRRLNVHMEVRLH